jgi:hypothetical protein
VRAVIRSCLSVSTTPPHLSVITFKHVKESDKSQIVFDQDLSKLKPLDCPDKQSGRNTGMDKSYLNEIEATLTPSAGIKLVTDSKPRRNSGMEGNCRSP